MALYNEKERERNECGSADGPWHSVVAVAVQLQ